MLCPYKHINIVLQPNFFKLLTIFTRFKYTPAGKICRICGSGLGRHLYPKAIFMVVYTFRMGFICLLL